MKTNHLLAGLNAILVVSIAGAAETNTSTLASINSAISSSIFVQAARVAASQSIAALSPTGPWTDRYEYDAAGRLRKVTFADGAITNYTLDNAGNRTTVNTTAP